MQVLARASRAAAKRKHLVRLPRAHGPSRAASSMLPYAPLCERSERSERSGQQASERADSKLDNWLGENLIVHLARCLLTHSAHANGFG